MSPDELSLPDKIRVLFASQTGQAESISEIIYRRLATRPGLDIQRHCVSQFETLTEQFWNAPDPTEHRFLLVIVASTTGQGDPPDKATKFYRWLRRQARNASPCPPLKHLSYALLGLGDTNYDNFAQFPKQLNKLLAELGATPFIAPAFADDAVGLELVTEPFVESLVERLNGASPSTQPEPVPDSCVARANMNINRPVVSSCAALSSAEKAALSDLCRQLVEPSPELAGLSLDQLDLPKYSPGEPAAAAGLVYSQKSLGEDFNRISVQQHLQARVLRQSPLHRGKATLTRILSSREPNRCCHRRKTVLECQVEYEPPEEQLEPEFVPGDSFGIYSANLLVDVYQVLMSSRVNTEHSDESVLLWDYLKVNRKQVFVMLPDKKTTLELLPHLVYGVDLRTVPKKATLCQLARYTGDCQQRRRLLELSSKQGNAEYQRLILEPSVTVCDILRLFETCQPPVNVLLANLMPAKPRYFSAASLPESVPGCARRRFRIAFSVANNFSHTFMRTSENLLGLFSGKFFRHYHFLPKNYHPDLACANLWDHVQVLHEHVQNGNILEGQDAAVLAPGTSFPVYVFSRLSQKFRLPVSAASPAQPVILIATGTGLTPFMAYLEALCQCSTTNREIFFLFGCRHPYQDFCYSERLIAYARGADSAEPLLHHLCLCFSRCSSSDLDRFERDSRMSLCGSAELDGEPVPRHVDQLIMVHGRELADWMVNRGASVYVCGNWKLISASVVRALSTILARHHFGQPDDDHSLPEAGQYLKEMQKSGRFLQDAWT